MRHFRGKREHGEWIYGYYCKWQHRHYIAPNPHECGFTGGEILMNDIAGFITVIPETVGRFTGLHDKKRTKEYPEGQEAYEKDVVLWDWSREHKNIKGVIEWDDKNLRWVITNTYFTNNRQVPLANFSIEVIDNIHSNPELLGEKEK